MGRAPLEEEAEMAKEHGNAVVADGVDVKAPVRVDAVGVAGVVIEVLQLLATARF